MKRVSVVCGVAAAFVLGVSPPVQAEGWNGDVNLLLAGKHLDEDDWGPTHRHGELGIQSTFQPPGWPIGLAADLLGSSRNEFVSRGIYNEQRTKTSELDLGVRKVWRPSARVRPYLGGGLALVSGEMELRGPFARAVDEDDGAGLWLGGGLFCTLNKAFNIGIDLKATGARVRLFGDRKNAGGFHTGLLVGYHWGG